MCTGYLHFMLHITAPKRALLWLPVSVCKGRCSSDPLEDVLISDRGGRADFVLLVGVYCYLQNPSNILHGK
jgi:hypothetical protein